MAERRRTKEVRIGDVIIGGRSSHRNSVHDKYKDTGCGGNGCSDPAAGARRMSDHPLHGS